MNDDSPEAQRGFQFPGQFDIAAMGPADADLPRLVPYLLDQAGFRLSAAEPRLRPSRGGRYLSVTVSFLADSREDYDRAHAALRAHPAIKWTL